MVLNGSCLCGGVRFTVTGELGTALNCHCGMCRKAHAAAFRTRVIVRRDSVTWQSGEQLIRRYQSSPTTTRTFCNTCGTRLMSEFAEDPEVYGMHLALFDGDPAVRPEMHIFVADKAPWHEITDDLPQFAGMPPSAV
jgi:hypothetical protein